MTTQENMYTLEFSEKEKRYAINYILHLASNISCENLHHPKKHQHEDGVVCLAESHRDKQILVVKQILEDVVKDVK